MKKKFYVHSEMVAAGKWTSDSGYYRADDRADELCMNVCDDDGKFLYEFTIALENLGGGRAGRVLVYDDAFRAFNDCVEVFRLLATAFHSESGCNFSDRWQQLIGVIENLGWEHQRPEKECDETCRECGQKVKK